MLRDGDVVEGNYRVGARLSATARAEVYAVTHVRFEGVRLVMKVAASAHAHDFDRDTNALASLTSPCVAHVYDRGKLIDGRLFRVVEQLDGPTLQDALAAGAFDDDRTMQLVVPLASLLHEAAANGLAPCDLSVDNLMFAAGRDGRLCLLRATVSQCIGADVEADRAALAALRIRLQRGTTSDWRAPSSMAELRAAVARSGKSTLPFDTSPGDRIQRWQVGVRIAETLRASVFEAVPHAQIAGKVTARCVLKLAGPESDHVEFVRHARMLAAVTSKHVVRVHDVGSHQDVPFYVMDALHQTLATRTKTEPLPVDVALQTTDELLWGALAIDGANGAPSDFSLEHAWQGTLHPSPAVLTHALAPLKGFRLYGRPRSTEHADAWSAAVTLYELIAGRLPFPTSRHSLAKAWLGMPVPLTARRHDVPIAVSDLVHAVLTGMKISTADLRRELTRIRSVPATTRSSIPPAFERTAKSPSLPPMPVMRAPTPVMDASFFPSPSIVPRASIAPNVPTTLVDVRSWRFVAAPRCPIGYVHTASFSKDEVVAVGASAVARYRSGQWTVHPARDLGIAAIRPFGESGFLALAARGHLLRLDGAGGFRPWGPPLERFVLWSVADDGDGVLLAGGTTNGRAGVVARLVGESVTILADRLDVPPIRALAPRGDGTFVGACEHGTIIHLRGGTVLERKRVCEANLLAVDVLEASGEIFAVGQGAWAFRCTLGPLRADPEPVDTTSSLGCLAHDGIVAWAGSERGRILRRHQGHWRRMNDSQLGEAAVLAIAASADGVRALLADGQLLVGRPT